MTVVVLRTSLAGVRLGSPDSSALASPGWQRQRGASVAGPLAAVLASGPWGLILWG